MAPQDPVIFQQLQQQAFHKAFTEQMRKLEDFRKASDAEGLLLEAQQQEMFQEIDRMKKSLDDLHSDQKTLAEALKQKAAQKKNLELQIAYLLDLCGMLEGKLFQKNAEGAAFFTLSPADFAYQHQMGEMELISLIEKSSDDLSFSLSGSTFCFLKTPSGSYYIHADAVDIMVLLQGI